MADYDPFYGDAIPRGYLPSMPYGQQLGNTAKAIFGAPTRFAGRMLGLKDPAAQNAVSAAMAAKADAGLNYTLTPRGSAPPMQRDVRLSERGPYNPRAPSTTGYPPGSESTVTPGGIPAVSRDVGGGVSRFDVAGQSPTFTNLGAVGVDDLARKGPALASVPGFLAGVRDMLPTNLGPRDSGGGMFTANDTGAPIFNVGTSTPSGGNAPSSGAPTWADMVANKQARVAAQQRTQQQIADATTLRARNEVPLALLSNTTQLRGQDLTHDVATAHNAITSRGIDVNAATHKYGVDMGLLPHLGQIAQGNALKNAYTKGDLQSVKDISQASNPNPFYPPEDKVTQDTAGRGVWISAPGQKPYFMTFEQATAATKNEKSAYARAMDGR